MKFNFSRWTEVEVPWKSLDSDGEEEPEEEFSVSHTRMSVQPQDGANISCRIRSDILSPRSRCYID